MKSRLSLILSICAIPFLISCQSTGVSDNTSSGFQPEDVLHSISGYDLKYKHILAYTDMEMEGEDPQKIFDQAFVQELTVEAIEEFAEAPAEFIADMDQHYEAILAGAGNLSMAQLNKTSNNTENQNTTISNAGNTTSNNTGNSDWNNLLTGSLLYYTVTESSTGITIQTTQYMNLCPGGAVHFFQNSGGGGGAITAGQQLEYTGSATWAVVTQGNQAFLQMNLQGQAGNFPMRWVGDKLVIDGLGNFSVERGAATCE